MLEMKLRYLIFLIFFYFIYLVIGAGIFYSIERPLELKRCKKAKDFVASFQLHYSKNTLQNESAENISDMLMSVAKFRHQGIEFFRNVSGNEVLFQVACPNNWDFESALFFCGTVVTTIGYGNIAPTTNVSRAVCVIYAIIGIVIFASMFNGLSGLFGHFIERLAGRIDSLRMGKHARNLLIFTAFAAFGFTFFCFIPGIIFSSVEEWSYEISIYYTIITLTTIGFGDYVAGKNPEKEYFVLYRIMVYFWILFGLAYMATFVKVLSDRLNHGSKVLVTEKSNEVSPEAEDEQDKMYDGVDRVDEVDGFESNFTENLIEDPESASEQSHKN